jgi:hypothetical protein
MAAKIIQFRFFSDEPDMGLEPPVKKDEKAGDQRRETEAALKIDGFILLAWALCRYGGHAEIISAWYLPEDGKQWVYKWEYDKKTMKAVGSPARTSGHEVYQWLKENRPGVFFKELHLCAPPYILLDNKELRAEYLNGNLEKAL